MSRKVKDDGRMFYINGLYYVRQDSTTDKYFVIGDSFLTLDEAIKACDADSKERY